MSSMSIKIFYFGNPYIEEDNFAIKVAEKLKKKMSGVEFVYIESIFQLIDKSFESEIILDVVEGIENVQILDIEKFVENKLSTTHDFDLGFLLKLKKQKVKIIGLPKKYSEDKAVREAKEIIERLS
jgi:Ni,Fe-hydrogenase maturation factor